MTHQVQHLMVVLLISILGGNGQALPIAAGVGLDADGDHSAVGNADLGGRRISRGHTGCLDEGLNAGAPFNLVCVAAGQFVACM